MNLFRKISVRCLRKGLTPSKETRDGDGVLAAGAGVACASCPGL